MASRGDERLTFPAHMVVADILEYEKHFWIRRATHEELVTDPTWYRPAAFRPVGFVFKDASFAQHFQSIGLSGDMVTAMESLAVEVVRAEPLMRLDHISTPPTPPPGAHHHY